MIENNIYEGNCLDVIKTFPDKSIDSVITSPPYWQLRDYKWDGQWGLEPTFQMYLENLWSLMDEIWRVLKDTGTVWINLGDSYSSVHTGGTRGVKSTIDDQTGVAQEIVQRKETNLPSKCLLLIPHRFAIGCIDRGWIMRNDIVWAKRNGMPESVTDRFSKKHEYFFFMTKKEKYYFDLDGIRDAHKQVSIERAQRGISEDNKWLNGADGQTKHNLSQPRPNITTKIPKEQSEMFGSPRARQHRESNTNDADAYNPKGKNPGSVSNFWDNKNQSFEEYMKECEQYYYSECDFFDIPTQGSNDAHYATYNTKLIDKPIVAGCPIGGIILDPFAGTATTGCRAIELQRKFIGIEGSAKFVKIGNKKLAPYIQQRQLF